MKSVFWTVSLIAFLSMVLSRSLGLAEQKLETIGEKQKVTLTLSGKFCDSYPEDIARALKDIPGVKAVDLKTKPGHALVELERGKTKGEQLAGVVNTVKGFGWYCQAQVMP
jgi:mercuric ion binding protein